jgi:hypothetical protein
METALYYTLSTISQTLAGALAVLVAVVLSQWSRVNDTAQVGGDLPQVRTPRQVRPRLYCAVGCSLVDIAVCFAAPPFTPAIAPYGTATTVVLAVTVTLGVACLVLYCASSVLCSPSDPDSVVSYR